DTPSNHHSDRARQRPLPRLFADPPPSQTHALSLHDALPIYQQPLGNQRSRPRGLTRVVSCPYKARPVPERARCSFTAIDGTGDHRVSDPVDDAADPGRCFRGRHAPVAVGDARAGPVPPPGHREAGAIGRGQARRKAMAMLWPPKPTDSLMAATSPVGISRGLSRTMSTTVSGSSSSMLMVGGIRPSCRARMVAIDSTAPAPPNRWPVMDLVEDTATRSAAASPRAERMARVSPTSPAGVEVACALTCAMSLGSSPLSVKAWVMARA